MKICGFFFVWLRTLEQKMIERFLPLFWKIQKKLHLRRKRTSETKKLEFSTCLNCLWWPSFSRERVVEGIHSSIRAWQAGGKRSRFTHVELKNQKPAKNSRKLRHRFVIRPNSEPKNGQLPLKFILLYLSGLYMGSQKMMTSSETVLELLQYISAQTSF